MDVENTRAVDGLAGEGAEGHYCLMLGDMQLHTRLDVVAQFHAISLGDVFRPNVTERAAYAVEGVGAAGGVGGGMGTQLTIGPIGTDIVNGDDELIANGQILRLLLSQSVGIQDGRRKNVETARQ